MLLKTTYRRPVFVQGHPRHSCVVWLYTSAPSTRVTSQSATTSYTRIRSRASPWTSSWRKWSIVWWRGWAPALPTLSVCHVPSSVTTPWWSGWRSWNGPRKCTRAWWTTWRRCSARSSTSAGSTKVGSGEKWKVFGCSLPWYDEYGIVSFGSPNFWFIYVFKWKDKYRSLCSQQYLLILNNHHCLNNVFIQSHLQETSNRTTKIGAAEVLCDVQYVKISCMWLWRCLIVLTGLTFGDLLAIIVDIWCQVWSDWQLSEICSLW